MRVCIVDSNGEPLKTEINLNDIVDVVVDTAVEADILKYNGNGVWESGPAPAPSPVSYNDRGDPSSWDFSKTDFTADGGYHVLDLSSKVPEGTTLVHLLVHALTAYNNSLIIFRKNGNINDVNREIIYVRHGNNTYLESKWVACDADRKIEYWTTDVVWVSLDVMVRGWFK